MKKYIISLSVILLVLSSSLQVFSGPHESLGLTGLFNPSELFTITTSHDPNPPLDVIVESNWRLGIMLDIYGERDPTFSNTDFWNYLMMRRYTDDFVVDIPIVKNP